MNTGESFAVISDIHGNSAALSAVLADMAARQISRAFNLGDTLYGPLDPQGACRMLRASPVVFTHIRGNGDRLLFEDPSGFNPTARHTLAALDGASLDWLGGHAPLFNEGRVMACHGTPGKDDEYLLEDIATGAAGVKTPEAISALLPEPRAADGSLKYSLVLCGHSHIPRLCLLPSGLTVVNPGSVGLPAYADTCPRPHRMETGTPLARYAVAWKTGAAWHVEFISLPYEFADMARLARANRRPDWAAALESGLA